MSDGIIIGAMLWIIIRVFILFRHKRYKAISIKRELIFNAFMIYCIAVIVVTFPLDPHWLGMPRTHASISIIPFVDIIQNSTFSLGFRIQLLVRNLVGNLLLLFPLGIFLPILWTEFRTLRKTFFVGALVSMIIEILQFIFTYLGLSRRITDIDDLLLNSIGV